MSSAFRLLTLWSQVNSIHSLLLLQQMASCIWFISRILLLLLFDEREKSQKDQRKEWQASPLISFHYFPWIIYRKWEAGTRSCGKISVMTRVLASRGITCLHSSLHEDRKWRCRTRNELSLSSWWRDDDDADDGMIDLSFRCHSSIIISSSWHWSLKEKSSRRKQRVLYRSTFPFAVYLLAILFFFLQQNPRH